MGAVVPSVLCRGRPSIRAEEPSTTGVGVGGPQLMAWTQQGWQAGSAPLTLHIVVLCLLTMSACTLQLSNNTAPAAIACHDMTLLECAA